MDVSSDSTTEPQALLAQAQRRLGTSPREARALAERALPVAEAQGDLAAACDLHLLAARCDEGNPGRAESLQHVEAALSAADALGDRVRAAECHRVMGMVHDYVGDFELAVESYMRSLGLLEATGDVQVRADVMRSIGVCMAKTAAFDESVKWYERSAELARAAGDTTRQLKALVNMGIDLKNLGRLDESLACYETALALLERFPSDAIGDIVLGNLGNTYTALGRYDEADRCFARIAQKVRDGGSAHALQNLLVGLGRVRTGQGRLDEARELLQEGLEVAERHGFRPDLGTIHEALAALHKARGDAPRALEHFEKFHAFAREYLVDESKRRLKAVDMRMRVEQSEREALRQREKSRELEEAFHRLRESAARKDEMLTRLERQRLEDATTGLPNARALEERLAAALLHEREGSTAAPVLGIVAVEIAAQREPAAAREALREAAHVLRSRLDERHLLAHLGDSDFAILFEGVDLEGAREACHRLCRAIDAHDWAAVHPWMKPRASASVCEVDRDGEVAGLLREVRAGARGAPVQSSPPAGEEHVDQRALIRAEQIRASYANLPLTFTVSLVAAAMLCLVVRDVIHMRVWASWLAAACVVTVAVLALCRRFQQRQPTGTRAHPWGHYAAALSLAAGVVWGTGTVLLHTPDSIDYQILVAVTAAIVASSAAFASAAYLPAFYAFFVPASVPSAVIFLNKDDATRVVTGLLLVFYIPVVTRFALTMNRAFIESLRLRFQNIALVGELRDKKDAAEGANVAKSHFLAAASHDLRQPMHALGLFLQSLRRGTLAERERQLVENIAASYDAMEALFDALLDVSRLDAGVVEPRVRTFEVRRMLERLRTDYAPQASAKGLVLSMRCRDSFVRSDPTLLEEIVGNFVSNAVRHTRRGRIVIACRRRGDRLRIEVWDTGPGIPEDRQRDVFRDFVQLGNPERDRRQGLGLGLAIVERLSRLLGHPVDLRSKPGRGSMFAVTVPLGDARDAQAVETTLAEAEQPEPFTGRFVVVVDDDPSVLSAMGTLLSDWGCETACAESGALILGKLATASRRPDLILCDYRLPGGESGVDVIAEIRAEFNEDIPAALITGDTGPDRLAEARKSGLPLLHKPLKAARLRALMAQLLSRSLAV